MKKLFFVLFSLTINVDTLAAFESTYEPLQSEKILFINGNILDGEGNELLDTDLLIACLLYTSPSPRDGLLSRMPSSA